jgi:membrane-bound lytic murein transglycosylase D
MGIPDEIKYLSIVESKLDPNAVSRVGATGPWQFMAATAKLYGLANDSYVDDRRDPIQASYAAAAYLKDAYMEFGDWLLAIASYNCGKSNVERAIEKAGALDFWSIRQYLPLETRGYVPAYIAIAYIMNYAKKQNITAENWAFAAKTDTVMVNRFISLRNISRILNIDAVELARLNPSYKKQVINGSAVHPRRLVIPKPELQNYTALYNELNTDNTIAPVLTTVPATIVPAQAFAATPVVTVVSPPAAPGDNIPDFHIVKRGETLVDIAANYGIELQDLKNWNNISKGKVATGRKIWLNDSHASEELQPVAKAQTKFIMYKVKPGDTLSMISEKFAGSSIESIRSLNKLKKGHLLPGTTLKISRG